ncbi:MAG: PorP/SprF family type IX secretion system membrane protein [Bacteroidia bacterium]
MSSLICLLLFAFSNAQDIHFSQFTKSPLNLNPSYTGLFDGDFRFGGIHRNQWKSVTVPYKTFSGYFDMNTALANSKDSRIGAGILINNDKAGDSEYGITGAALSGSMIKSLGSDAVHFLSGGLQLGFVQQSFNYSKLTFDNQFNGDVFDPTIPVSENFTDDKYIYFDLSAGIGWMYTVNEKLNLGAGVGIFHINKPKQTFMNDEDSKLDQKISFDARSMIAVHEKVYLLPGILFSTQDKFQEFDLGSNVKFILNENPGKKINLYAGGFVRTKDAIIFSAGFDYNELNFGFSYDMNTSDLKRASNNRGGYEVSLTYIIKKVKPVGIHPPCPVY